MSLITRCPVCSTMFKVVPDQLRISEGWVRCGHCSEVFDATTQLQHGAAKESAAAVTLATAPEAVPGAPEPARPSILETFAALREAPIALPLQLPSRRADEDPPEQPAEALEPAEHPARFSPPAEAFEPAPPVEPAADPVPEPLAEPIAEPVTEAVAEPAAEPIAEPVPEAAAEPLPEEPSESTLHGMGFVREARRKAFWSKPLVRAGMLLVCLVLLAGLVLQAALQGRDRLAAADPRAAAWLQALCEPLGCSIEPLRQIESIAIESSSFNRARGETYRLALSVRNKSPLALAMPGIELTLTDAQDKPVLRRVLLPAELGAAAVLGAGAEWSGNLPVAIAAAGGNARVAGYRVLAFYP